MVSLLLASTSPRRRELLSLLGIPFEVVSPDVQEDAVNDGKAEDIALCLARMKAEAAARTEQEKIIVAADTMVLLRGQVMGKPADAAAASAILAALRGRKHQVISGLAVADPDCQAITIEAVETRVWMRNYADEEIAGYIGRGEPFDKAGGYAIQDQRFLPVARIEGCYANVMGLPLCHLYVILERMNLSPLTSPLQACETFTAQSCLVANRILQRYND